MGVIREIGDGVAKVEGLTDAMLNEMLDLGHGITGLALNLEETEVGVIILGDYTELEEGDEVRAKSKLFKCLGRSMKPPTARPQARADMFILPHLPVDFWLEQVACAAPPSLPGTAGRATGSRS